MKPECVEIRPSRPGEAARISEIAMLSKAMHGYSPDFMERCRAELTYSEHDLSSDGMSFLVADFDRVVIGFGALMLGEKPECELEALFIHPDYVRNGLGEKLFTALSRIAIQRAYTIMYIQSDPGAAAFYERVGASYVRQSPSGSIPGRTLPVYRMELEHITPLPT